MKVTYEQIVDAILKLQLANKIICLHSSLKSFGYVEGGADTLVEAFLAQGCTLVVPTFAFNTQLPAPEGRIVLRNGGTSAQKRKEIRDNPFKYRVESNIVAKEMGAIPQAVLNNPKRIRGEHQLNSLTAVGPKAQALITKQKPLTVYGPYQYIYEQEDGILLLMGVDLTKATPLHFAEQLAGRNMFRRWASDSNGNVVEVEVGSCSAGFEHFKNFLLDIEDNVKVGESNWRIFSFRKFIDKSVAAIKNNPRITHCNSQECHRCEDAVQGGPII